MPANEHIGEAAELYAAGQLDPAEIAAIEAHAAGCEACLRRLGEAEETVLALERVSAPVAIPVASNVLQFPRRGLSPWWFVPAMAAALLVGILWPRAQPQYNVATLAMVNGHFSHAQFAGTGPRAKVLYARDRSWYYVIVAGSERYDVYGVAGSDRISLGTTTPSGSTSELFVRSKLRFDKLQLQGNGAVSTSAVIR